MTGSLIERILELRGVVTVVHHVKGRIRLRVQSDAIKRLPPLNGADVASLGRAVEGIRDIQFNWASASLVIHYDPQVILPSNWEDLIEGEESRVARAVEVLRAKIPESALPYLTGESR
jgi:hypothetical protein